jgi:NAD(P)H-dependent FMN reductase
LEKARDWAKGHMPAAVDKATGDALAQAAWRGKDFDEVSGLAVQYSEAAGNDETLAAFLKNHVVRHGHAQQAAALIAKIKDPALRAEISGLAEYKEPSSEP